MRCPECDRENVTEELIPEVRYDGQGFWQETEYYYVCEDCGCEFTLTETITRKITVERHGSEYEE